MLHSTSDSQVREPLSIAVIPGDGIGTIVSEAGRAAIEAALGAARKVEFTVFDWSSERYLKEGAYIPEGGLDELKQHDAILFGAAGWPTVPDHISLWDLRLAICQGFDQGICVRPARLLPNVPSPLRNGTDETVDFVIVRENTEGEYSGVGGRVHRGVKGELAIQSSVVSRHAVERVGRYAFELAAKRPAKHLISVTKSNASQYACVFWDEVMLELAAEFPEVTFESVLVDAVAARLILNPESADVLVASNLHADILSDLTAALAGGLGIAPSSNLSCDDRFPSMFEPVHGSAPDLKRQEDANPIGAILCSAMLLDEVGENEAAERIRKAVAATCEAGILTADVGGSATTMEVADAIVEHLNSQS